MIIGRRSENEIRLDRSGRLLGQVKTGVDHLAEKLKHIKTVSYCDSIKALSIIVTHSSASFPYSQTAIGTWKRRGNP